MKAKDPLNDIELIEKFLGGRMSDAEKQAFGLRMETDTSFNKLVQDMDTMVEGIKYSGHKTTVEEKLNRLKKLGPDIAAFEATGLRESFKRKNSRYWLAAACVTLVVTVSVLLLRSYDASPDNKELFAAYFEPFDSPGSGLTRSRSDQDSLKDEAYRSYDQHQFEKAAQLFERILETNDDAIMHLCLGNAWLALDQVRKAEEAFIHILEHHSDLVTQAKWYLALTYLKQGKTERTKATLWEISQSSTYGEKARRLLEDLE